MAGGARWRPRARSDVIEQARWIAKDDPEAALRFLVAVRGASERLVALPEIGARRRFRSPRLRAVRLWPVPDFPKVLIF
jgi:plasmid stabilization system protein ParE